MKVKDIKKKVAAKVAKGKSKIAKKCGRKIAKSCAVTAMLCAALCGCHMGEAPTAQRAQTAITNVYVYEGATASFGAEFVSLAQSNETAGTESMTASPTITPTVTTDTDAALEVPVNKANSAPAAAATGAAEKLLGAGVDWIKDKMTAAPAPTAPAANATVSCKDGNCTITDGTVTETCTDCVDCDTCEFK